MLRKVIANAVLTVVLVALCVVGLFFFNRAAAPYTKVLPVEGALDPDYGAIAKGLTQDVLERDLRALRRRPDAKPSRRAQGASRIRVFPDQPSSSSA